MSEPSQGHFPAAADHGEHVRPPVDGTADPEVLADDGSIQQAPADLADLPVDPFEPLNPA